MIEDNLYISESLDELDIEPVFIVSYRNLFGAEKTIKFYEVHLEYRNLFNKKREVAYDRIISVGCVKSRIFIKIKGSLFALALRGVENASSVCRKIREVAGLNNEKRTC